MPGGSPRPFPSPNDPIEMRGWWIRAWLFLTVCLCLFGFAFVGGVWAFVHDRSYGMAWVIGLFTGLPLTICFVQWARLLRILVLWRK